MRLRGEPPASPLPPYQGQAGEEQDGTDRDVFLPRGNCSEGNLQTPAAEPHPPPPRPQLALTLAWLWPWRELWTWPTLTLCVELDEALLECHSTFSGCSSPLFGGASDRGNPSSCLVRRGGHRAAGQRLLAGLWGSWRLCTVAGLFALPPEKYTNTSCFLYSHKCPVHSAARRPGLANRGIQQAGRQNWIFV